ncbi:MAG: hypothetical protein MJ244_03695 [Clostridia bacterium]|nr:hypothetical protein [Clostridia bacterium]
MELTLEKLEEIEKNYKKVYEEELNRVFEMYPNARVLYEAKDKVMINDVPKKKRIFFFKRRKSNMIKLESK